MAVGFSNYSTPTAQRVAISSGFETGSDGWSTDTFWYGDTFHHHAGAQSFGWGMPGTATYTTLKTITTGSAGFLDFWYLTDVLDHTVATVKVEGQSDVTLVATNGVWRHSTTIPIGSGPSLVQFVLVLSGSSGMYFYLDD